jgi:hypothetical protein
LRQKNAKKNEQSILDMENLDMSGTSEMLQYIPTIEVVSEKPVEKNSEQVDMDFSTPIADVLPAAAFDPSPDNSATYNSPTTQRVAGVAPGMLAAPSQSSKDHGYPLGLTAEQFAAALAGVAAAIAYSTPVQEKLADMIPKFMSDAGQLSMTGMAITAALVAVIFFFAMRFLKNQR